MKKTFRRSLSWLLSVVMVFGLFVVPASLKVSATQSSSSFNTSYSLNGNSANDIVAVANAQIGKNGSSLGYSEQWCADFVCDCAKYAKISDSIIPHNYSGRGACTLLYNRMIGNCGAKVVSSAQPGDIIFWGQLDDFSHVGIVVNSTNAVSGNNSTTYPHDLYLSTVKKYGFDQAGDELKNWVILRPNYDNRPLDTISPTITNARAENVSGDSFTIKCTLSDNVGVTRVWLNIYGPGGSNGYAVEASNGLFSHTIQTSAYGGAGDYSVHIYAFDAAENSDAVAVNDIHAVSSTTTGYVMSESEAAGQTILDGDYYIVSGINSDYFIDIKGNDFDIKNATNLQMKIWDSSFPDKEGYDCFHFEYLNNGFYKITQINTEKCIDVCGASLERGTNIYMWDYTGNNAQQWSIEKTDHGYRIRSRCNAYYIDVCGGEYANGTNLFCWGSNNAEPQCFGFIPRDLSERPVSDGAYFIRPSVSDQHFLDVSGKPGGFYSGSNVQIWKSSDTVPEEEYIIQYTGDGWYKIIEKTSGFVLEVAEKDTGLLNEFKNVQIGNDINANNQLWKIRKNSDGTFFIINKMSGYYLDYYYGKTDNGTNVSQISYNGNFSQRWIIELETYNVSYDLNGGSGSIRNQTKTYGQDLTLSNKMPTRTDYEFVGWNTDKNATTAQYQPGDNYTTNGNVTLYAIWKIHHSYKTEVVAPTCTEQGYTVHTCSNCGDSFKDTYTDALGHDYTDTVVAPTKTEKGYTLHTCTRCGDSYKDNYTDPITDVAAESLTLDKSTVDVNVGQLAIVTATVKPDNATDKNVTWTSTDNTIATVTDGVIKGVKAGQAVVIAKTSNGLTAYVIVNVKADSTPLANNSTISATKVTTGTKVTLTGKASGGAGDYTYALMYKKHSSSTWIKIGEKYTTVNKGSFTPKTATTYDVRIIVKDGAGKTVKKEFTLTVTAANTALTNKSTVSATEVKKGTKVTLTAKATGGTAPYTYALMYKKSSSSTWTKIGTKYGTASTGSFKPGSATTYDIMINVKDNTGKVKSKTFTLTVK